MDLGDLELEQALQEALVRPAHEQRRPARGAADLEDVGLDVLADAVVLERRLLGRGEDTLDTLAHVQDHRPRLDAVDGAGDELTILVRELIEHGVALGLAQALEHDLLGGLGADSAEGVAVELLDLHQLARDRVGLVPASLVEGEVGQLLLFLDRVGGSDAGAVDPDAAAVGVDLDVDVLFVGDAPVGGGNRILDRPDELLARDLLLGVELEQCADEIPTHRAAPPLRIPVAAEKKRGGHPRPRRPSSARGSIQRGRGSVDGRSNERTMRRCRRNVLSPSPGSWSRSCCSSSWGRRRGVRGASTAA